MQARYTTSEDYKRLESWWEDHGWTPPPISSLPNKGNGGVIISYENNDVCAGFIYETNSDIAWMEFIISDKNADKDIRSKCLDLLIDTLTRVAKEKGFKSIYTSTNSKSLESRYNRNGFITGSENCKEMIKIWQQ